jgi:transposase
MLELGMSYEIHADRSQTFLLPPALDDWVPSDHPARFVAEFVESLDLPAMGFEVGHAPVGRPSYSAELLLSIYCYCYFSGIRAFRHLERACSENVAVMWIAGLQRPDHNSFWRFIRDNKKVLRGLLKQSVQVAARLGLVEMVLNAVDGTKIQAAASMKTARYRRTLEAALQRLDKSIEEFETELERSAEEELDGYRLPEELADAQERREAIRRSLLELNRAETNTLSPNDPDARVMKCSGKQLLGYNAQAVADESGIVLAAEVFQNENDRGLLSTMIERVEENVGQIAAETLADKGYSSAEDLGEAEEKAIPVLVNLPQNVAPPEGTSPFHASRFTYDAERDCCICPIGRELKLQRSRKSRRGLFTKVYHCACYRDCPMRKRCSSNKRGRTIELSNHHQAVENQRQKLQAPGAKEKLDRRGVIVEPVFAVVKEVLGFRRWSVRGLENVRTQWALICSIVNLRKLYPLWRANLVT